MHMKIPILTFCLSPVIAFAITASGEDSKSAPRVIDLKAPDGTILKATYFAATKPGPGVLLFHQSNRTRKSWDDVAAKLAAAGINTLTVDARGSRERKPWSPADLDPVFAFLLSQPG